MPVMYKQCLLERFNGTHHDKMTSWLPCKGLRPGNFVELLGDEDGLWKVVEIYKTELTEKQVKAKGDVIRKGFPSLKGMNKNLSIFTTKS